MSFLVAALAGVLFALGLALADMTSPARVRAFLDVGGSVGEWDPTLAFVMIGAIAVYAPVARLAARRTGPRFDDRFHVPTAQQLDVRLVGGAALFGIGWGLSGYCPGPALVALGTLSTSVLVFVGALIAGIAAMRLVTSRV